LNTFPLKAKGEKRKQLHRAQHLVSTKKQPKPKTPCSPAGKRNVVFKKGGKEKETKRRGLMLREVVARS
jgi:hypothetical protein